MLKYRLYLIILIVLFSLWLYLLVKSIVNNDVGLIMITMTLCMLHAAFILGINGEYKRYKQKINK